jgi:hypothetical protein
MMKRLVLVAIAAMLIAPCSHGQFMMQFMSGMANQAEGAAMFSFQHDFSGYLAGNWFKNWDYIRTGGRGGGGIMPTIFQ